MFASRELRSAEYLCTDSPDESEAELEQPAGSMPTGVHAHRTRTLLPQESCDFSFIDDQHDCDQDEQRYIGEVPGGEISVAHTISAAALKFRASTVLTEKIIAEVSASIRVFKPSRSLHELVTDREEQQSQNQNLTQTAAQSLPTASIDLVVSGGGLKGYFVCGCVSVLQRQLASHNIHIARVSGASAGAWSGFFVCTGVTTAMWMESYYKCYDNPNRLQCCALPGG
jgi:hypothetical protein